MTKPNDAAMKYYKLTAKVEAVHGCSVEPSAKRIAADIDIRCNRGDGYYISHIRLTPVKTKKAKVQDNATR